jgi:hypothetical protein
MGVLMSRITGYAVLASVQPDDILLVVDVNDTSMAVSGTDKQMTISTLMTSPALTGAPTAPTQAAGDTSTLIATDAFAVTAAAAAVTYYQRIFAV